MSCSAPECVNFGRRSGTFRATRCNCFSMLSLAPMYVHSNRYRAEAGPSSYGQINYAAEINQRLAKGIVGEFLYPAGKEPARDFSTT